MLDSRREIILYSRTETGHRASYIHFVGGLFPSRRGTIKDLFLSRQTVFFLMIEDSFPLYVLVALFRTVFGLRTAGILMRPKPAVEGQSLRLRIKRAGLKLLRMLPTVQTLTIVPFELYPEFAIVADDWIYDFQLWDLTEADYKAAEQAGSSAFVGSIRAAAKGKPVVVAIGGQDRRKGFDIFSNAFTAHERVSDRFHFAAGGRVSPDMAIAKERLEKQGASIIDRHVSDEELIQLYAAADLIWALYAADYDQASGILGRAVQLDLAPIVRTGSLSHRFCLTENIDHIAADEASLDKIAAFTSPRQIGEGRERAARFREISVRHLARALGTAAR